MLACRPRPARRFSLSSSFSLLFWLAPLALVPLALTIGCGPVGDGNPNTGVAGSGGNAGNTGSAGTSGGAGTTGAAGTGGATTGGSSGGGTTGGGGGTAGASAGRGGTGGTAGGGSAGSSGTTGTAGSSAGRGGATAGAGGGSAGTGGGAAGRGGAGGGTAGRGGAGGTGAGGTGGLMCQAMETCTPGATCEGTCNRQGLRLECACPTSGQLLCTTTRCPVDAGTGTDGGTPTCPTGTSTGDNCNTSDDEVCNTTCSATSMMNRTCLCAPTGSGTRGQWACTTLMDCTP